MTVLDPVLVQTREAKATCEAELEEIKARASELQSLLATLDDVEDRLTTAGVPQPPARKPVPKAKARAPKAKRTTTRGERVPPAGERIVAVLTHRDQATARELAEALGDISAAGIAQACKKLIDREQLATTTPPRRGTETVYCLPSAPPAGDRDSSPAYPRSWPAVGGVGAVVTLDHQAQRPQLSELELDVLELHPGVQGDARRIPVVGVQEPENPALRGRELQGLLVTFGRGRRRGSAGCSGDRRDVLRLVSGRRLATGVRGNRRGAAA